MPASYRPRASRPWLLAAGLGLALSTQAAISQAAISQAAMSPAVTDSALGLVVKGIAENQPIPARYAHCMPDAAQHSRDGDDISPRVSWHKGPEGTRSYALVMHDIDVPADFADANQENKVIPAEAARRPAFYHWLLTDIPPEVTVLPERAESKDAKQILPIGAQENGTRYANSFGMMDHRAHGGYDGPCPPWNDARLHHYFFTLYALDTPRLALPKDADGDAVVQALHGHVLAQQAISGTYSQNPDVK